MCKQVCVYGVSQQQLWSCKGLTEQCPDYGAHPEATGSVSVGPTEPAQILGISQEGSEVWAGPALTPLTQVSA